MTKEEMLRIMRVLSALETIGVIDSSRWSNYLSEEIKKAVEILEREILK